MPSPRDQLLATVLLERGIVQEPDLRRVWQECDARSSAGVAVALGQLLVQTRLLDPGRLQYLDNELSANGRGCKACGHRFVRAQAAPEQCPRCGQADLARLPGSGPGAPGSGSFVRPPQTPYMSNAPGTGRFQAPDLSGSPMASQAPGGWTPTQPDSGAFNPVGGPPSGSLTQSYGSTAGGSLVNSVYMSGSFRGPSPMASQGPGQDMSGKFRMPVAGFNAPSTTAPAATPPPSGDANSGKFKAAGDGQLSEGSVFAGHMILKELGRGGMGVVYKARDEETGEEVALKVLLAGEFASKKIIKRFEDEIAVLQALEHPNIIPIKKFGNEANIHWFTMGFVDGCGLDELIKERKLSMRRGLEILAEVSHGISEAHDKGIVHRDLKPANIMVDREGTPYIMDFGLAKDLDEDHGLTRSGVPIGTPYYMPPEQARGDHRNIDDRADVYSLGAVLYEIITHRVPFKASTTTELLRMIIEDEVTPPRQLRPRCPPEYEAICLQALAKDPDDRYPSAFDLAEDLDAALAGRPISARADNIFSKLRRKIRMHRKKVTIGLVVFFVLVGGAILVNEWHEATKAADEARRLADIERQKKLEEQRKAEKERERKKEEERKKALKAAEEEEARRQAEKLAAELRDIRESARRSLEKGRASESVEKWKSLLQSAERSVGEIFAAHSTAVTAEDYFLRGTIRRDLCHLEAARKDFLKAAEADNYRARGYVEAAFIEIVYNRDTSTASRYLAQARAASELESRADAEGERTAAAFATKFLESLEPRANPSAIIRELKSLPPDPKTSYQLSRFYYTVANVLEKDPEKAEQATRALADAARAAQSALRQNRYGYFFNTHAALMEFQLAAKLKDKRRLSSAEKLLEVAETVSSELAEVYEVRAIFRVLQGRPREAKVVIEKALSRAAGRPKVVAELQALREKIVNLKPPAPMPPGLPSDALQVVSLETEKEDYTTPASMSVTRPSFSPSFKKKAAEPIYLQAVQAFRRKAYDVVIEKINELWKVEPAHFKSYVLVGLSHTRLKNHEGEIANYKAMVENYPESDWAKKFLALAYGKADKHDEAIKLFEDIHQRRKKDWEVNLFLAKSYEAKGETEKAIAIARAGLEHSPHQLALLNIAGQGLSNLERWKEASKYVRLCYRVKPGKQTALNFMIVNARARSFKPEDKAFFAYFSENDLKNNAIMVYAWGIYDMQHGDKTIARKRLQLASQHIKEGTPLKADIEKALKTLEN